MPPPASASRVIRQTVPVFVMAISGRLIGIARVPPPPMWNLLGRWLTWLVFHLLPSNQTSKYCGEPSASLKYSARCGLPEASTAALHWLIRLDPFLIGSTTCAFSCVIGSCCGLPSLRCQVRPASLLRV